MSTIIVVEPRPLIRRGLLQLIAETAPGCIARGAVDADIHLGPAPAQPAGCELMLLSLPHLADIYESVAIARLAYRPKAILLLSDSSTLETWPLGLPPEVIGCVPIHGPPETLQLSIRRALEGGLLPRPGADPPPGGGEPAAGLGPENEADSAPAAMPACTHQESEILGLTRRQYEVLVLLARGYSLKAIARDLNIAATTAKVHAETLYQRLRVHNRNEAVYAAISRGATLGWPAMAREEAKAA